MPALLFCLILAAPGVVALNAPAMPQPVPQHILDSPGFLTYHPDIRHQQEGLARLQQGRNQAAMDSFVRAARHADKLSQAMIARMYWQGVGVWSDRATAYAWMDIAAERGFVPLLAEREAMWAALDEEEQARAITIGRGLYAEFGDQYAQPRMEQVLRAGIRRSVTGSRTGWNTGVRQLEPNADGLFDFKRGASGRIDVLDPRWWDPARYWHLQDERWAQVGFAARD
ncbi:MAG: sel1 repeat family protein [Xanthomonadales bacterium]|nr:sel1 repeat family protein [Xanthomonadales bacterium]